MPIPFQTFADGSPWTPDIANAVFRPQFDDQQATFLDSNPRLLDSSLSNAAGQLKERFSRFELGLAPTQGAGRVINVAGGTVRNLDQTLTVITGAPVTVPDNSTSFIFISSAGALTVASNLSVHCVPIARVVTAANAVTSLVDLRYKPFFEVAPQPRTVQLVGGSSSVDLTPANGASLTDGLYYCRDFTVGTGVTISVSRFTKIICSGNAVIQGTINVAQQPPDTLTFQPYATGTPVLGFTARGVGAAGRAYQWQQQPYGTNGSLCNLLQNAAPTGNAFNSGQAGLGGGTFWLQANGSITITNGTINAQGTSATIWTTQTGNTSGLTLLASGNGGGSGGLIVLVSSQSITANSPSVLNVSGGSGSSVFQVGVSGTSAEGNAGAGGVIVAIAPILNNSATQNLSPGAQPRIFTNVAGATGNASFNAVVPNGGAAIAPANGGGFGKDASSVTNTPSGGNTVWTSTASPGGLYQPLTLLPNGGI